MFTFENLPIIMVVGLLLWNGLTILQFMTFLYYKFKYSNFTIMDKNQLDDHTLDIIKPFEDFLISNGFVYQSMMIHESMIIGNFLKYHTLYYYNPLNHVHAFIRTLPHRGALEAATITYETIYESKNICTSLNGEKHHIAVVPEYVYLFDHYFSSLDKVYQSHLNDRNIENENISKETFTPMGIVDYKTYDEHAYIEAWEKIGIVKMTKYGYRFTFSWVLWKFSKESIKGEKKFSQILKGEKVEQTKYDIQSQINGILTQLKELEKPRGESNKMLWFSISLIAFVVLFGLLGLSVIDVLMLVIVLFIHELGHFAAMRYFGYTDTSIFFLPFGAATVGKKENRTAFEEYVVSLAGPLPGIFIGIGIIVSNLLYNNSFIGDGYLQMYAMMSLIINYINLLPIYPLDGGRILQTLLLLRYPKGQFYFYLISLGILITAMLWMQDPILLIFVVIIGFGLKQSYRISQLLQKLLNGKDEKEITQSEVVNALVEDDKYTKETLASKANIAKQAILLLNTGKPSKILIVLGMGFYLFLITPPLFVGSFVFNTMNQSVYDNLTKEEKMELGTFNKKILEYKGLTSIDDVNYTLEDSMKILDTYFASPTVQRHIGLPLVNIIDDSVLACTIPKDQLKILRWHNGIDMFLPYQKLFSYQEVLDKYDFIKKENESYGEMENVKFILSIGDEESYGLAYKCNEDGLYDFSPYSYDSNNVKMYYNWNHFLKITAEAYIQGVYEENNQKLYIDEKRLAKLSRKYYSSQDQEKYQEFIEYLADKSKIYKNIKNEILKISLLQAIGNTYDSKLLNAVQMYLYDENDKVKEQAIYVLGDIGDKSTLSLLLSYTKSIKSTERNFSLLSISKIVDKKDKEILESLYPLLKDEDILVRLSLYEVINKIEDPESLSYLRKSFNKENARGKLDIIDIFSKIGVNNELVLLKEYLNEVNQLDMEQKDLGGFRGTNPHPKILKQHIEDAINEIEKREVI